MFFDQLKILCKENNISVTSLIQQLGMSKGTITNWKKGVIPNGETILKFANYFNVSTDYLLTGKHRNDDLSQEENDWLNLYRQLSLSDPDTKNECIGFVKGYIAGNKK
ncbi:MAG: helix-turn-helix domain-containing protein [Clostridiales bacterium]|nr:helix-turn-helix domain-containing protein [Clostridiales bacterium]